MAVKQSARYEASRNKVPPALRSWVASVGQGVKQINRFCEDCERFNRGWTVIADRVKLRPLPDGFRFSAVSDRERRDGVRLQIREE